MEFEFGIIYKQKYGGAKYSLLTVEARTMQEAKDYAFSMYSHIINVETFVKVVKIGKL